MGSSFASRVRHVLQTSDIPRLASVGIIVLGIASALLEGAGMYLFVPLIENLRTEPTSSAVAGFFEPLLRPFSQETRVALLVLGLCLCILLKNLVSQSNYLVTRYYEGQVAHRLRTRVLRQTLDSCIDYRVDNRASDIINTMATHTWQVGAALSQLHHMAVAAVSIVVFLILLATLSPALTLIAIVFLGVSMGVIAVVSRRAEAVGQQVVQENKRFGVRMWENLRSLRLIRSFSRESDELTRFDETSDTLRRRMLRMEALWALPTPVTEVTAAVLIGILILVGYRLQVGVGELAAFLVILYRMQRPMREVLTSRVTFDAHVPAVQDVADYFERTARPFILSGDRPFVRLRDGIELRDLSFRYPEGDAHALDGVSLSIPRGTTTAIVGRSGSGKSTLMDLLFRFRDPTGGEILVDSVPLHDLDLHSWRARLSIMSQHVYILNDTVAANIGYGRLGASPEEIQRAAKIAGAAEFIEALPYGYQTVLGDAGVRLSGGQRQRLALARTILRDPDVLLLDEATNALDPESERLFQAALREYRRGRTLVVIAHRLSTVEDADQVVMLNAGRVVESGPPEELLTAGGPFARLHRLHAPDRVVSEH